jgi:SAM-dependent methyltransferase
MKCRVCDSEDLELVIDLGMQPWGNNFLKKEEIGKEPYYPLHVLYCNNCHTAQLDYTVKKEIMFGNHTYLSGITTTLSEHFKDVALEVDSIFLKNKNPKAVLDIGSNDGTQLKHFKTLGYDILGVESSKRTALIANAEGIPTINQFFNLECLKEIDRKFDVINASGVFFHLEELHSVCDAIKYGLKKDGIFVVQFLYIKSIIDNLAFDQIYHEHLLYYSLETIQTLLKKHGLEIFDAQLKPIHGGTIIAYAGHEKYRKLTKRYNNMIKIEREMGVNSIQTYKKFSMDIKQMKEDNIKYLKKEKALGKKIYGFGAPVKGNTLLNYFDIGNDILDCLVEKNNLRKGMYSPGKHIPIILEDEITELPDIYYVLAWNFKEEILKNNKQLIDKGVKFYFPINIKEI